MKYWIGIDVGGTKIAAHMVNKTFDPVWQAIQPTAKAADLIPAICHMIDQALTFLNDSDTLEGIGLGIPGKVIPSTGEIHLATNLDIKEPVAIGKVLQERFHTNVIIENDVRVGAIGVYRLLKKDNVAFINIGTGLAAGIVLNGQLYRGRNGLAGELGHIAETYPDGSQAILENYVSGPGIVMQAQKAMCEVSNPAEVFHLAETGNSQAKNVLEQFFYHLARAIQWLVLTFDVDHLVIGGGVTHASKRFESCLQSAIAKLRDQSKVAKLLLTNDKLSILPESHNPGLWGATYLIQELADSSGHS